MLPKETTPTIWEFCAFSNFSIFEVNCFNEYLEQFARFWKSQYYKNLQFYQLMLLSDLLAARCITDLMMIFVELRKRHLLQRGDQVVKQRQVN